MNWNYNYELTTKGVVHVSELKQSVKKNKKEKELKVTKVEFLNKFTLEEYFMKEVNILLQKYK